MFCFGFRRSLVRWADLPARGVASRPDAAASGRLKPIAPHATADLTPARWPSGLKMPSRHSQDFLKTTRLPQAAGPCRDLPSRPYPASDLASLNKYIYFYQTTGTRGTGDIRQGSGHIRQSRVIEVVLSTSSGALEAGKGNLRLALVGAWAIILLLAVWLALQGIAPGFVVMFRPLETGSSTGPAQPSETGIVHPTNDGGQHEDQD